MAPLVRFPDHTWKHFEESLDSPFSQFQWLEITGNTCQAPLPLPLESLVKHRFPSLKTLVTGLLCAGL